MPTTPQARGTPAKPHALLSNKDPSVCFLIRDKEPESRPLVGGVRPAAQRRAGPICSPGALSRAERGQGDSPGNERPVWARCYGTHGGTGTAGSD